MIVGAVDVPISGFRWHVPSRDRSVDVAPGVVVTGRVFDGHTTLKGDLAPWCALFVDGDSDAGIAFDVVPDDGINFISVFILIFLEFSFAIFGLFNL